MKTKREMITEILTKKGGKRLTLSEITALVAKRRKAESRYLSGSISTLLTRMYNVGEVKIDGRQTGPRGGAMYYIKG